MDSNSHLKPIRRAKKIKAKNVSERAKIAIMTLVENRGMSKGEALRIAGYSKKIQRNPKEVFNSPSVQAYLDKVGVRPEKVIKSIYRKLDSKRHTLIKVPLHVDDVALDDEGIPVCQTSSLLDGDILHIFDTVGYEVINIEHRNDTRVVWCSVPQNGNVADSETKLMAILGLEAPRRSEVKQDVNHSFSLLDLRKKMEEDSFEVIQPKIHDV